MTNFSEKLEEAKKTFTPHKKLKVRIKDDATNPFGLYMFEHFLLMKEEHGRSIYELYIHTRDGYMSFSCPSCEAMDTARQPIDDKLWVEILCMFEIVKKKKVKAASKK